jgi:SOS response associated peptidase (SRAP)
MCGRYGRRGDKQKISERFQVKGDLESLAMPDAEYNIAPTSNQPIIRQSRDTGEREMVLARWGLIPFFTKSLTDIKGLSTINARADKVEKSPTWREPMKNAAASFRRAGSMSGLRMQKLLNSLTSWRWRTGKCSGSQGFGMPGKIMKATGSNPSPW